MIRHSSIAVYFAIRVLSALVLLKLSTAFLPVEQFANFAQFLAFSSLLNMAVVAGAQNGLIREAAAANDQKLVDVHAAGLGHGDHISHRQPDRFQRHGPVTHHGRHGSLISLGDNTAVGNAVRGNATGTAAKL